MHPRLLALGAAALLAAPALALAQPNRYEIETRVPAGERATLRIGTVPQGEFSFSIRVSSDGPKRFTLTQQRNGAAPFVVLRAPGPQASACQGAAGSLICTQIQTPATPAGRTWTFRFTNRSGRPMGLTMRITHRRVANAG